MKLRNKETGKIVEVLTDWDIEDEYEKGQRRKDLDLLFGGEE